MRLLFSGPVGPVCGAYILAGHGPSMRQSCGQGKVASGPFYASM